jgi:hypothetical protein
MTKLEWSLGGAMRNMEMPLVEIPIRHSCLVIH